MVTEDKLIILVQKSAVKNVFSLICVYYIAKAKKTYTISHHGAEFFFFFIVTFFPIAVRTNLYFV